MSESIIGDDLWAGLTEAQKIEAVVAGQATLKQMSEGLLDGSEELRRVCRESLAHTDSAFLNLPLVTNTSTSPEKSLIEKVSEAQNVLRTKAASRLPGHSTKPRFGLPEGFVPRLQRFGRGVLLEQNIYRLPSGREFVPARPEGTLGSRQHLYALLTVEQYASKQRGSVYVRNDGRIFDYSADSSNPFGEFFDTGYTIYDLERTGHYAPPLRKKRKKKQQAKANSAAAGR